MKFLPLLALLTISSPALANDTFSVVTTDRHTFTVQRNNVECKETQALNDNRKNFTCSAYGIMTDLLGNQRQYNQKDVYCAISNNSGKTWEWFSDNDFWLNHETLGNKSVTCAAVRHWNNI